MHTSGIFGFLEMKLYDFRFSLRGAISGTPLYSKTKLPSEEYFVDNNNNNNNNNTNNKNNNNNKMNIRMGMTIEVTIKVQIKVKSALG